MGTLRLVENGRPYRNDAMWQLHEDLVAAASWEKLGAPDFQRLS